MSAPKPPTKHRLDQLLVERGLFDSRAKAQGAIMAGLVFVKGQRADKPGAQVAHDAPVEVRGKEHPYVSRGGMKLARALEHFTIDPIGKTCLDVGASTGGFTDVLLRRGAAKVYAVDVGHGQLAWSLRNDPRVVVLERANARHITRAQVPDPIDLVVCDASFIGLATVLPASLALMAPGAHLVALIKPQFEVGPDKVGKGGIVRDSALHAAVCDRIAAWLGELPGWSVLGVIPSPIEGADGNREFLIAGRLDTSRRGPT
jgi:23S rRNA (cytidine1920-2'-O)/16S rRNA (cytidine1409-2'-O)-methyltransferase